MTDSLTPDEHFHQVEEFSLRFEVERLQQRCNPSKTVMIGDTGHYVSEAVFAEIDRLQQDVARYRSSHDVHMLLIETQRDKIKQLEAKLHAAEQLSVRQGNEIRKLRAGERA